MAAAPGVAGADLSVRLADGMYLTGTVSAFGGLGAMIQHPVLDSGIALGVEYRRASRAFVVCSSTRQGACGSPLPNAEMAGTGLVGGRALALVRVPSSDVGLYGTVSAGYALAFDQPSVSVSLAFVVF